LLVDQQADRDQKKQKMLKARLIELNTVSIGINVFVFAQGIWTLSTVENNVGVIVSRIIQNTVCAVFLLHRFFVKPKQIFHQINFAVAIIQLIINNLSTAATEDDLTHRFKDWALGINQQVVISLLLIYMVVFRDDKYSLHVTFVIVAVNLFSILISSGFQGGELNLLEYGLIWLLSVGCSFILYSTAKMFLAILRETQEFLNGLIT